MQDQDTENYNSLLIDSKENLNKWREIPYS